jgi:hypothetical protein
MMVNATSVVTQHRLDPNASHREAILYVALQLYHLFWRPSQSQVVKNGPLSYPLVASLLVVVVAVVLLYVSLEGLSNPLVTLGVLARPLHMRGYDVA